MNRVVISGHIQAIEAAGTGRRLLVVHTTAEPPERVLVAFAGTTPLRVGDHIESEGRLGDQEPVIVAGATVSTSDGRIAMRNVYHAETVTRIGPAHHHATTWSPKAPSAGRPVSREERCHGHGPELPWD